MGIKRNLLRTAKLNSLSANFKSGGHAEVASPDMVRVYQHDGTPIFPPPTPATFLESLKRRGQVEDSASAEKNRDLVSHLWKLPTEQLCERPSHADYLREWGYRPRARSGLGTEVRREDVVQVEFVDGAALWEDGEEEEGQEGNGEEESGGSEGSEGSGSEEEIETAVAVEVAVGEWVEVRGEVLGETACWIDGEAAAAVATATAGGGDGSGFDGGNWLDFFGKAQEEVWDASGRRIEW